MGSAVSLAEKNIDSIHAQTYRALQLELPAKDFQTLTGSSEYRRKSFSDAAFFHEQLKLYLVKPLYVGVVFLLWKTGFSLSLGTLIPSLFSTICIGLFIFFWMQKKMKPMHAGILNTLIMLSPPFWDVARYATPDALGGLLVLIAFYFLVERKNFTAFSVLMIAGMLIRIDLALLFLLTIIWLMFPGRKFLSLANGVLITSATVVVVIAVVELLFAGNKGESLTAFYNFGMDNTDALSNYFRKFTGLFPQLRYTFFTVFLAVPMMTLLFTRTLSEWKTNFNVQVILLLFSYTVTRLVLFPSLEDRFFIAEYLIQVIVSVRCWRERNLFTV